MLNIIYAVSKLLTVFVQYEDHELVVTLMLPIGWYLVFYDLFISSYAETVCTYVHVLQSSYCTQQVPNC